ncbi:MAG TPA: helix-turn-helix domain-containing protein [Solirubrobacteraceae bacterium]|jgi:hypothetical protein|nr:helix-turn-helix domain-containing protein [Solirubrobacteraceae bacterium]
MAEIGAMLREARMRDRIDVSEIEAKTKIRAKYLRALENEEWDLLPGPTYVKSFLRTYAEALGLDGKLLVEEYKLGHERLSDVEMQPIMAGGPAPRERGRRPRVGVPRWLLAAAGAVAVVVILLIIGSSSNTGTTHHRTANPAASRGKHGTAGPAGLAPAARPVVRVALQLLPTGPVYVCLQAYGGRKVLNGVTLSPGTRQPVYHSRRFKITLGNGSVRMRIDGRLLPVPQVSTAVNYVITAHGRRPLPSTQAPRCA